MNRSGENFDKAFQRFAEALEWEENPATRDSAILRFELCYETAWKATQVRAREEGMPVNGPRQSFEAAFQLGWISDEELWDDIIRTRNNAIHTYNDEYSKEVYRKLPLFREAFQELRQKVLELS